MSLDTSKKKTALVKKGLVIALFGLVVAGCGDQGNIPEPPPDKRPPLGVTKIDPLQSKTPSANNN